MKQRAPEPTRTVYYEAHKGYYSEDKSQGIHAYSFQKLFLLVRAPMEIYNGPIDHFFLKCAKRLLNLLVHITGKDNFTIARVALALTALWGGITIGTSLVDISTFWEGLYALLTIVVWAWMLIRSTRVIKTLENLNDSLGSGTINLDLKALSDLKFCFFLRTIYMIMFIAECILGWQDVLPVILTNFPVMLSLSLYFASCGNPGGKTIWSKAKDWAVAHKPSFSPLPSPA